MLSEIEGKQFYQFPIVVEEKPDGANVGISINNNALVWIQNRGNFVDPGGHPQLIYCENYKNNQGVENQESWIGCWL